MDREETTSYGFIHPKDVLRAVHLIPVFVSGTIARVPEASNEEWEFFYVSMYLHSLIHCPLHTDNCLDL
jgi:hypothetical protein